MDQVEGIAVATHFFLVAVTKCGLAEYDGADAGLVDLDPLDPVRRHGTLDQSVLPQHLELLRRLLGKQFLFAERLPQVGQIPGSCGRDGSRRLRELSQRHHAPPPGKPCVSMR